MKTTVYLVVKLEVEHNPTPDLEELAQHVSSECSYDVSMDEDGIVISDTEIVDVSLKRPEAPIEDE